MTDKQFQKKLDKLNKQKLVAEQQEKLNAIKDTFPKKKMTETSKKIAIYLFILTNILLIYAMISMWVFRDLSYLGVLITDVAAQILAYLIYCTKAYFGKKQEEIMKFEWGRLETGAPLPNEEDDASDDTDTIPDPSDGMLNGDDAVG